MGWLKGTNNCVYLVTWLAVYFLIPILGKVSLILKVQFYFLIVCWHFFSPHFLSLLVFFFSCLVQFFALKSCLLDCDEGREVESGFTWVAPCTMLLSSCLNCCPSSCVICSGSNSNDSRTSSNEEILLSCCCVCYVLTCAWNVLDLLPSVSNWRYNRLSTQEERHASQ